jgi:hypothetical protein
MHERKKIQKRKMRETLLRRPKKMKETLDQGFKKYNQKEKMMKPEGNIERNLAGKMKNSQSGSW